jgi:hypothetical protein
VWARRGDRFSDLQKRTQPAGLAGRKSKLQRSNRHCWPVHAPLIITGAPLPGFPGAAQSYRGCGISVLAHMTEHGSEGGKNVRQHVLPKRYSHNRTLLYGMAAHHHRCGVCYCF